MVILFRLLARLPLPVLHNLGATAGWLAWLLSPTYRRRLKANLRQAGLLEYRWAAIAEAGKGLFELPWVWLRPNEKVRAAAVRVSGLAHVEAALSAGRGIIFLTPHLGCFDFCAQYVARFAPLTVLYRQPRQAFVGRLIEIGRGANNQLAPADLSGVRKLLRALKHNEAVGILPDQAPAAGEGVWAPFFGRPAWTMTLAARLMETGAAPIFIYAERLAYGAGFHVRFFAPQEDLSGGVAERVAAINRQIEALIRECPGQYLWSYNRYKIPRGVSAPDMTHERGG